MSEDDPDASTDDSADQPSATHPTTDGDGDGIDVVDVLGKFARVTKTFLQVLARILFVGVMLVVGHLRGDTRDNPLRRWFLLAGDRWTIIGTMTLSFFLVVLFLGATDVIGIQQGGFVVEMFSTIVAGLFSFVPVVIAVNSLSMTGLSNSLGGIESRVENVQRFRDEVADLSPTTVVTPTDPAGFLDVVTTTLRSRIGAVREGVEDVDDPARTDVLSVADDVDRATDDVERVVEGNPGVIEALVPMMDEDFSRDINRIRQLRQVYADLPATVSESLEDVQSLLESLDVTRAYFKTMYLQQELAALSRYIAYAGVNALIWAMFVIMTFANGTPDVNHGTTLLLLVSVGMTAAFFPFAILFAYVVRIATVIKRTSAPGAFTPQKEGSDAR